MLPRGDSIIRVRIEPIRRAGVNWLRRELMNALYSIVDRYY